jgi:hypothetical protein
LGDRKCLEDPRKSIVGLPKAILFFSILRERVFQQPRDVSPTERMRNVNVASKIEMLLRFSAASHFVTRLWMPARFENPMKLRGIFWTGAMAYSGFLLTGRGLRTFNSLSVTEGFLGALTGLLLAMMFTLRERRRRRPAFIAHSIAEIMPNWGIPDKNRRSRPNVKD